jgi:hypothetical protein
MSNLPRLHTLWQTIRGSTQQTSASLTVINILQPDLWRLSHTMLLALCTLIWMLICVITFFPPKLATRAGLQSTKGSSKGGSFFETCSCKWYQRTEPTHTSINVGGYSQKSCHISIVTTHTTGLYIRVGEKSKHKQ